MRADRLLSILLLLQIDRRQTARELAERLEVSERTILRDMDALGAAGVPVMSGRGSGGGWSLAQGYKTDLTGLNTAELRALLFAKSERLLEDLGLGPAADAASIKLLASMPPTSRREVEFMRARLHVDGAGWYQSSEQFPQLALIQQAVWEERKLSMSYQRADSSQSERVVDPLGLVAKGRVWYLVAGSGTELRSFRVSRILSARILDEASVRPGDFDLGAYWERSVAEFVAATPRFEVSVRASPDFQSRVRRSHFVRVDDEGEIEGNGWSVLKLRFEDEREACDFLIRAGAEAVVIEPHETKDRLCAMAQAILRIYA